MTLDPVGPACPACKTPLVEPIDYAAGALLVRGGTLRIATLDSGRKSAVWTCRRCGQQMELGEEWAAAAEVFFRLPCDPQPAPVRAIRVRAVSQAELTRR